MRIPRDELLRFRRQCDAMTDATLPPDDAISGPSVATVPPSDVRDGDNVAAAPSLTSVPLEAFQTVFNRLTEAEAQLRRSECRVTALLVQLDQDRLALSDGSERVHQAEAERLAATARENLARKELEAVQVGAQLVAEHLESVAGELELERVRTRELAESQAAMARELAEAQDQLVDMAARPVNILHRLARVLGFGPARA